MAKSKSMGGPLGTVDEKMEGVFLPFAAISKKIPSIYSPIVPNGPPIDLLR